MNKGKKRHLYKGQLLTTKEAAELAGVTPGCFTARLKAGYSVEYSIDCSKELYMHSRAKATSKMASVWSYKGKDYSTRALADMVGISKAAMWARLTRLGMTVEEAVEARRVSGSKKKPIGWRRKNCKLYELNGKEYTLNELSEMHGIKPATIKTRMFKFKWSVEKAITKKPKANPKFWYQDDLFTIGELAEKAGCKYETMRNRLARNRNGDKAVALGPERPKKQPQKLIQGQE